MVAGPITVVQMLPELESGGVERGTLEMGRFLAARGHRSVVISAGGRLVDRLVAEGSRHLAWRTGDKHPGSLRYLPALRRLLLEAPVDVLHLRSRMPAWIGYLAWKSLPRHRRPALVTTFHGIYSVNAYSAVMTRGARVIVISRAVADHVHRRYGVPARRLVLIHRGVDTGLFDPDRVTSERVAALQRRWGLPGQGPPVIMLPGRLTGWKGQDVFIESLSRLRHLDWHALCVGDTRASPTLTARLRQMIAERGLEDRVRLVGHCDDMPAALFLADVVVSASSFQPEAFGRIAVEAQAMARPVVATAHGGSLETVKDGQTGWLVRPRDPAALAEALVEALARPGERQRRGEQGRRRVLERFTMECMCQKTLNLYQALLADRTPRRTTSEPL